MNYDIRFSLKTIRNVITLFWNFHIEPYFHASTPSFNAPTQSRLPRAQFVKGEDEGKLSSGGGGKKNKAAAEGIFLEIKFSRLVSMFFKNILPPIDIDS